MLAGYQYRRERPDSTAIRPMTRPSWKLGFKGLTIE